MAASAVEPLTNYFVTRVQRDLGSRAAAAGFITTAVNRRLDTVALENGLSSHAYVVGADAHLFLDADRQWVVTEKLASSHVRSSASCIDRYNVTASAVLWASGCAARHTRSDPHRVGRSLRPHHF